MKINILSPEIFNLIAAGEVVENPSSIVKELVENAIDASSNNISVHIEDGGIKSIIVSDDGIGINKNEIEKTILPHATSKIVTATDLSAVSTLGFRGEALASISAVSDFEIRSRHYKFEIGKSLKVKGQTRSLSDCGCNIGTTVIVKNLFYNTPARFKFLNSPKSEENKITRLLKRLILANPDIAFKYYIDNKLSLASDGQGLDNALKSIYSANELKNMLYVENQINNIKIWGYISNPNLSKFNRNEQLLIINGRIIENMNITASIQNAYRDRLMRRQFPIYILNIIVPFREVDINVHPNKKEVRFATSSKVVGSIYNAIRLTLQNYEQKTKKNIFNDSLISMRKIVDSPDKDDTSFEHKTTGNNNYIDFDKNGSINTKYNQYELGDNRKKTDKNDIFKNIISNDLKIENNIKSYSFFEFYNKNNVEINELSSADTKITTEKIHDYKIIGQAFGTYFIVEYKEDLYFIDQHAVHERMIFDDFLMQLDNLDNIIVQPQLVPIVLDFDNEEYDILSKNLESIAKIGLSIEVFGLNTLKINSLPVLFEKVSIYEFLKDLSKLLLSDSTIKFKNLAKEVIAKLACSAAIKGNTIFSQSEIERIFSFMISNTFPTQCPHGRPTFFVFSKNDIEKKFKRR